MAVIAYNFLIEMFTALRNIRLVSVMQLVNSVAFAVLGVALLLSWRCGAESVCWPMAGRAWSRPSGPVADCRGCGTPRRRSGLAPSHAALWAKVVPFAAWVLLASVLMNLFGVVDRYMILHFSRTPAVAALDAGIISRKAAANI